MTKGSPSGENARPGATQATAAGRFSLLESRKHSVLQRGIDCAKLTLPALLPPQGHTEGSTLPTPYHGLGARAVNTLASKILLALFPPNTSFFKLALDEFTDAAAKDAGMDTAALAETFSQIERAALAQMEQAAMRPQLGIGLKLLLVTGNALLAVGKDAATRVFNLHSYVANRDPEGNVLEVILRENVSPETLKDEVRAACQIDARNQEVDKTVQLFTWMRREGDQYTVSQEINGHEVPGSAGSYPLDAPGFTPLRWTAIPGEDYGRGMVEEYFGDFDALNNLSRDLLKASAAAAKIIPLVDPSSAIRPKDLENAQSGDVLRGKKEDVTMLTLDKFADFRVVLERIRDLKAELSEAFLMHQSVQRDAERVTAEEIRFLAQELEDALGGVYSILAQELQAPLVRRVVNLMTQANKLPPLPKDDVRMTITTGMEALGRGHDLNKLVSYLKVMTELLGPEAVMGRLNEDTVYKSVAAAMSINTKDLLLDDKQADEKMQKRMAMQMVTESAPGVASAVARNVTAKS